MAGLTYITKIIVPLDSINMVYEHLRKAGESGMEGVALWAGSAVESFFVVGTAIIPRQIASRLDDGLLYSVEGDELYRINVWLYNNDMTLVAQLHSHPAEAYHSETDDAFPIVAVLGGISIVIPWFAAYPFDLSDWAVFRLKEHSGWTELSNKEVKELIEII
jgi:hypothetical protein